MAERYNHREVERKWQTRWKESKAFRTEDASSLPKVYVLDMFPYPSGEGLHVGHPKGYIATDIYSRYMRMKGYNVLHPMGWDAFGLPAENYAIANKIHPHIAVQKNIAHFKDQLAHIGFDYDWSREINTTDPKYYKWTQWIFLQLFKKGLAYQSDEPINWCPSCMTGLANEDLDGIACERCGTSVEKRKLPQWVLKITAYADRMLTDLGGLQWPEYIKEAQRNWIGRSEGVEIDFPLNWPSPSMDVVFATNNKGKVTRMQKLFKAAGLSVTLKTPLEIGLTDFEVTEDAPTLRANAEKKARALAEKTALPVFADDTGFFIDDEEIDPITVKRNALAGLDEKTLSVEAVGARMEKYYQNIATARGGKVDAQWRQALCFITPEKYAMHGEAVRLVVLTNESHGKVDPYLPLRGLYIPKATGKYALEQSEEEELIELQPITDTIKKLFTPAIAVFTTRPDTLFGATYMVLAPEHPFVEACLQKKKEVLQNTAEVRSYVERARKKTEIERAEHKEKTGVELKGVRAINPATKEEIPIYVADYVLAGYGTGAIMAVPAHDERDFEFAKKFGLPVSNAELVDPKKITETVGGVWTVQYKLKDWVFSRQRYWGEPIPIIHCPKDGAVAVPESDLPVLLPEVESYEPSGTGESPLANITEWVNTVCPTCGGPAKRETNTMPQWAGSSWYYLRFMDPHNDEMPVSKEKEKYWAPVDVYVGGDHAVRHLIYARFWHKFLYDIKVVSTAEPFARLEFLGFILAEDGRKMSKRYGNVISPEVVVSRVGADVFRLYEMFMGPFENTIAWNPKSINGVSRFVERVWRMQETVQEENVATLAVVVEQTVKKVGDDVEAFKFNTAVSQMMILLNAVEKEKTIGKEQWKKFLQILNPFAPHLAHELAERAGFVREEWERWPTVDTSKLASGFLRVGVQINGKVRGSIELTTSSTQKEALAAARAHPAVSKWLAEGREVKALYVPCKIVSFVVEKN